LLTVALGVTLVAIGGIAAAFTVTAGASPGGTTITITVPSNVTSTITVPRSAPTSTAVPPADAAHVRAARDDPGQISMVKDGHTRRVLQSELRDLDAFLRMRPKLRSYREHLWYVAHHSTRSVSPRRLASLLWCTVWFPRDCG
jgi:hypothetical protein